MQREMNETPPEYNFAGMTVFSSTFGGREAAVILEAEIADDGPPRRPAARLRQVPLPARLLFGTLPVSLAMLSLSIQPTHTPFQSYAGRARALRRVPGAASTQGMIQHAAVGIIIPLRVAVLGSHRIHGPSPNPSTLICTSSSESEQRRQIRFVGISVFDCERQSSPANQHMLSREVPRYSSTRHATCHISDGAR